MDVRGKLIENAPLGEIGWFRCGGKAARMFKPADRDDLIAFLQQNQGDDIHTFGILSNTIVRDSGLSGTTIKMGKEFAQVDVLEGHRVRAGAAAIDKTVAMTAARAGIAGLEFFSGIPGSIGGALRMNAGCYGTETRDVLIEAEVLDPQGNLHVMTPQEMGMAYRHSDVAADWVFISGLFQGQPGDPDKIEAHMDEIRERREASQPIREKTGGSTFANPSPEQIENAGLPEGTKVWQLIDKAGGRGLRVGGAQMSEKHCNFMINTGTATATDLETLGEEIRTRVLNDCGISLRWEVKRVGG